MAFLDFLNKLPTVNELKGSFGEWLAKIFAKTMSDALVLHDVLIDGAEGYTSQIDLIMIGGKGVYVVEVKNFEDAKVYGEIKKSKWNYYKHGHKYEIYSPLKQNKKHIEYMKEFLQDFSDVPFFSIILMLCDNFKISGEMDGYSLICNSLSAMERGIYKLAEDKPIVFDDAKKQAIYEYISNNQHIGKTVRSEHKSNVIAYNSSLEEMKAQKICPYCKIELVLRSGKNGEFYGCKNFPKCRYTLKK